MVAIRKPVLPPEWEDPPPPPPMTVEAFLDAAGDAVETKRELVDGRPRAMAPASVTHGALQLALGRLLENHLIATGSSCRTVAEPAVRPRIRPDVNLRVPDLGVSCAEDAPGQIALPDPVLLVEILSPGNEAATRANVWAYVTIASVREILLVHSTRIGAELFRRGDDGEWPELALMLGPDDELRLDSVAFTVPLAALYERTHLRRTLV